MHKAGFEPLISQRSSSFPYRLINIRERCVVYRYQCNDIIITLPDDVNRVEMLDVIKRGGGERDDDEEGLDNFTEGVNAIAMVVHVYA